MVAAAAAAAAEANAEILHSAAVAPAPSSPFITPAANSIGTYTSSNGKSYTFNADPMTFEGAEAYCQTLNSHLASYTTLEEQIAVESFFIDLGVLLPGYHNFYWIGLNTSRWPNFRWAGFSLCEGGPGRQRAHCSTFFGAQPAVLTVVG
jgi:hypothetical protein